MTLVIEAAQADTARQAQAMDSLMIAPGVHAQAGRPTAAVIVSAVCAAAGQRGHC